jgi:predicted nucleic acid-binding protein
MDAFIAAIAAHRLTLVTRNTKDFETTGVRLFNPMV